MIFEQGVLMDYFLQWYFNCIEFNLYNGIIGYWYDLFFVFLFDFEILEVVDFIVDSILDFVIGYGMVVVLI